MKHLKTFGQLNELKSLERYDANTFISNKLIGFLNKLSKFLVADDGTFISDDSTEREIIYKVTKDIIDSIIEFYDLEDNAENRKKINSLFHVYNNIVNNLQLHVHGKEKDFDNIYIKGKIFEDRIRIMISLLIEELKKKYPEWVEGSEFKKSEILPYVKSKFQGDDLARRIYDWNVTFDTLEKLFYDFLHENLNDDEYEKYKGLIDSNLDKFKEYVVKNDYLEIISDKRYYPNIIRTLDQTRIIDKKYLYNYIYSLHDLGIEHKLFDEDFIEFLDKLKKFISK